MTDDSLGFATINRDAPNRRQLLSRELGLSSFGCNVLVLPPRARGRGHSSQNG